MELINAYKALSEEEKQVFQKETGLKVVKTTKSSGKDTKYGAFGTKVASELASAHGLTENDFSDEERSTTTWKSGLRKGQRKINKPEVEAKIAKMVKSEEPKEIKIEETKEESEPEETVETDEEPEDLF